MNFPWANAIAREDAASLAALRLVPDLEVGEAGAEIWLRGKRGDEQLDAKLAALPARGRYEWLAPNQLRPINQRIPSLYFPEIRWQPLQAWLQVEIAAAAMPAHGPRRVPLNLVRSVAEREPGLLQTNLAEVKRFVANAAKVRLERLQFAANSDGEVLIRGNPLPPLSGRRFVLHGGIAVPAGFSWHPAVGLDVLARAFGVSGDLLLIWNEDGTVNRVLGEQFVPLTRSAVGATGGELNYLR